MNKNFIFVLNNQDKIETPFSSKLIGKLGDEISQKIFSGIYYVQSQVSRESFQTFLDYLYDKKENPKLTVDNYYELQLLSDEFNGNLSEYLSKEEFEKIKCLSILKNSKTEEKGDVSNCEEYIAINLDYFLENYSREMREMRTTTLYNIFKHERRKLNNHERAYEFIKELVKSGKESDCVLFETLDCNEMSEKSIKEAISNKEKNYRFLPDFNQSFISDIKSQMDIIMNQQTQMMNAINSILNEKINSINDNYLLLSQKIDESNNKINQKIDKIITENEKTKNEIKKNTEKIIEENKTINNKIDNMPQKIEKIGSKVNEALTKIDGNSREISYIKEKVELIKRKNSEIETKIIEGNQNLTQKIEESNNKILFANNVQLDGSDYPTSSLNDSLKKDEDSVNTSEKLVKKVSKPKVIIKKIIVDDLTKLSSEEPYENQIKIEYNTGIKTVLDLRKIVAKNLGFTKADEIDLISLFILFTTKNGNDPVLLSDTERIAEIMSENPKQHILYLIVKDKKDASRAYLRNYSKRAKQLGLTLTSDDIQNIHARSNGNMDIVISTLDYIANQKI